MGRGCGRRVWEEVWEEGVRGGCERRVWEEGVGGGCGKRVWEEGVGGGVGGGYGRSKVACVHVCIIAKLLYTEALHS